MVESFPKTLVHAQYIKVEAMEDSDSRSGASNFQVEIWGGLRVNGSGFKF